MITHHNQLPITSVHTQNNKLTMTLFSIPEITWRMPKWCSIIRKIITVLKIIPKIQWLAFWKTKRVKSLICLQIVHINNFIAIITIIIIIIIIIIVSRVRALGCSNFTMPISFLDIPHLFYLWDYIHLRSLEFVIHPLLVTVLPNVSRSYTILTSMGVTSTRVGTLIVATIYLQLIQNRYMFRSFTVLQCSHQHCVQPVASDVEVVGYL